MDVTDRRAAARARAGDALLAAALLGLMVAELGLKQPLAGEAATTPAAYAWAVLITAPVAVHRRWPVPALLATAAGVAGYASGHWTAYPGYAAFALVFLVSLRCDRGRGLVALGVQTAALLVAIGLQDAPTVTTSTWVTTVLTLLVAWLAGDNLRVRRERWTALQARAKRLEEDREERARRAVADERLRIARELHDVVAHSMSVIAVQAGVAHHVIDSRPELARQALATVETNTRAALVEMRRLLGVLRRPDEPSGSLAPAPGLADVPALVDQFAEAGLAVEVSGDPPPGLPDGVDLSAYRIVQEGLTNVLRHGGPRAVLRIEHAAGELRIAIADDGPATPRSGGEPGHGLIGMRERVAVFGGTLTAGPRAGGGFDLVATLPYAPVAVAS